MPQQVIDHRFSITKGGWYSKRGRTNDAWGDYWGALLAAWQSRYGCPHPNTLPCHYIVYRTRSWHLAISRLKRPRTAKPRPYGAPLRTRPGGVARERDGRLPGIGPSRKWGALKRLREGGYVREFARRARWPFAMRSAKAATRDGRLPGTRPARWPFARHPASEMAVCQASGQL